MFNPNVIPIPGFKNQKRILENLAAWNVELTDKEFESIESALNKITIHGHRRHVETQQATFDNNWNSKKFPKATLLGNFLMTDY